MGRGCVDQIFTLKQIGERAQEKKYRVYVGFIDLEVYNREALWQVLRMSDVGGESKLLNGIKNMHVDNSVCVRVKGDESEQFKRDSGMR